jgi:glycosyltransferase involved in cell wall biosynthesis
VIYLNLPVGSTHGWGVCGKYVAREMTQLAPTCLLTASLDPEIIGNDLEFYELRRLLPQTQTLADLPTSPLLQAISGADLTPIQPQFRGGRTVGYAFFEDNRLSPQAIEVAKQRYDLVTTGSSWCTQVLKEHGVNNVETVLQGIDPTIFFPLECPRQFLRDKFVVFSGGKFELRKGQDIVIRAFKVLADRHPDAMLVTAWFNQWGFSWETMRSSPNILFAPTSNNYFEALAKIFADNRVDPNRTINLPPRPNYTFPPIYRTTDVGMFPNRCEGGTNLVLMEYMACGMPVIATNSTGHADVVNAQNALVIDSARNLTLQRGNAPPVQWPEPDLEQAVEKLEWAYRNREKLKPLAQKGAVDMANLTWAHCAANFHRVLTRNATSAASE